MSDDNEDAQRKANEERYLEGQRRGLDNFTKAMKSRMLYDAPAEPRNEKEQPRTKAGRRQTDAALRKQRHQALRTLPPCRDLGDHRLDIVINAVLHPHLRLLALAKRRLNIGDGTDDWF